MTRRKVFLIVESTLCAAVAVLLAAGAVSLYLEGAAKQAENDLFHYIFTREKAAAKLLPILPLFFCTAGFAVAGVILGVKDEKADLPVRDEKLLRNLGSSHEKAARLQANRKTVILRTAVIVAAVGLIVLGILNGGLEDVLAKGAAVCTECIGIG